LLAAVSRPTDLLTIIIPHSRCTFGSCRVPTDLDRVRSVAFRRARVASTLHERRHTSHRTYDRHCRTAGTKYRRRAAPWSSTAVNSPRRPASTSPRSSHTEDLLHRPASHTSNHLYHCTHTHTRKHEHVQAATVMRCPSYESP